MSKSKLLTRPVDAGEETKYQWSLKLLIFWFILLERKTLKELKAATRNSSEDNSKNRRQGLGLERQFCVFIVRLSNRTRNHILKSIGTNNLYCSFEFFLQSLKHLIISLFNWLILLCFCDRIAFLNLVSTEYWFLLLSYVIGKWKHFIFSLGVSWIAKHHIVFLRF